MTFQDKLTKLPAYLNEKRLSPYKFFLAINKDIQGRWSIGYCDFQRNKVLHSRNDFLILEDAVNWMYKEVSKDFSKTESPGE